MNTRCMLSSVVIASAMAFCNSLKTSAQDSQVPLSEILVEVTRGSIVESRHYGRLVAVTAEGEIQFAFGNPRELIFPRSALKPMQALATVMLAQEQGIELPTEEVAIMCASHEGHDYHVQAVKLLLARAGASESDLYCGPLSGSRLRANCSGKHGGILLHAKLGGFPFDAYWKVEHPVQQRIQQAIAEFTDYREPFQFGTDGCGVPNYALPLYNVALGYARLATPDAAPEKFRAAAKTIRDAMQAHPELISSRDSFDAKLMQSANGQLLGKTGAEACYGLGLTQPAVGVAVKIEDGNPRGMPCVLLQTIEHLGAMTPEMETSVGAKRTIAVSNTVQETVGEIRAAAWPTTVTAK